MDYYGMTIKGMVGVVNKWKIAMIVVMYWIGMSALARGFYLILGDKPLEYYLNTVWTGTAAIMVIVFAILRRKWSVFFAGLIPYFISSIPIVGQLAVLGFVGYQTYKIEENKLTQATNAISKT
jgi:hypothetical protein